MASVSTIDSAPVVSWLRDSKTRSCFGMAAVPALEWRRARDARKLIAVVTI